MIIQKYKKEIAIEWVFVVISIILTIATYFINYLDGRSNMNPALGGFFEEYDHDFFFMFWQIYLIVSFIRITKWSIKIIKDNNHKVDK